MLHKTEYQPSGTVNMMQVTVSLTEVTFYFWQRITEIDYHFNQAFTEKYIVSHLLQCFIIG